MEVSCGELPHDNSGKLAANRGSGLQYTRFNIGKLSQVVHVNQTLKHCSIVGFKIEIANEAFCTVMADAPLTRFPISFIRID